MSQATRGLSPGSRGRRRERTVNQDPRTARPRTGVAARRRAVACLGACLATAVVCAGPARAREAAPGTPTVAREASGSGHVIDGSYVMNIGDLQLNITNFGLIGSQYTDVSTFSDAPSGQWPAGSGNEYLWGAGLWIGGVSRAQRHVSTGLYERELRPLNRAQDTIYEARNAQVVRPSGNPGIRGVRLPQPGCDDDGDGRTDEETLNGFDDDGDGLVDEDFGQLGQQMMVCTMYDNTAVSREQYPDHVPMDLKVVQTAFGWDAPEFRNFVGLSYKITNVGSALIEDVYIGFLVDCDIGPRDRPEAAMDDLAGFFAGPVRATDGTWTDVTVGYMRDGADQDPLPGYFGVIFLGPEGSPSTRIRAFRSFTGLQPYESGGDPVSDDQRYAVLATARRDPDTLPRERNDYRFLVSVGPWGSLGPGASMQVDLALAVGEGRDGLLQGCADALAAWRGRYYDLDHNSTTGTRGRETKFCYAQMPGSGNSIYQMSADYFDGSCVGENVRRTLIQPNDFFYDHGLYCIWVNADNCDECARRAGQPCTQDNLLFEQYWNCNQDVWPYYRPAQAMLGCTGIHGAEGRVPFVVDRMPPPPPGLRVAPGNDEAHVYWNDDSEHVPDPQLGIIDFESYRIWRSDDWDRPFGTSLANGPETSTWHLIDEFDVPSWYVWDRTVQSGTLRDTIPLGRNTGLEGIAYRPVCLDDPRLAGLAEAMQALVDGDTRDEWKVRPPLRGLDGVPIPGLESLLPWEHYPAALDTFFMTAVRAADPAHGVVGKRGSRFYEYVDRQAHNGFIYFYSVTATDQRIVWEGNAPVVRGAGLSGPPGSSFTNVQPGTPAQSAEERARVGANIFVYPNPATRAALAEFQRFHPNADDPTGERVMFANLPACPSRISIFTLDGDLVQELWHDGTTGIGEASWNLISRSGQEVVSGIYLYVVEPENHDFRRFTGKFVIIR